jgi:preprotein translocase subunit SecE
LLPRVQKTRCVLKKKLQDSVNGVKVFTSEVVGEMKKSTWPSRQELLESTIVVIVCLVLMSLFVGFCDRVLVMILRLLIPTGCV